MYNHTPSSRFSSQVWEPETHTVPETGKKRFQPERDTVELCVWWKAENLALEVFSCSLSPHWSYDLYLFDFFEKQLELNKKE